MNSSQNSQSSPGFVYFNTNSASYSNKSDTSEFLAFSDSPQQQSSPYKNKFSPGNYSSPQKFRGRGRGYQNNSNWNQNRRSGGNFNNRSFNSSNNSSFNSSYNKSWNKSFSQGGNSKQKDISRYLHPSFMEDPWVRLEQQLKRKEEQEQLNSTQTESENQNNSLDNSLNKDSEVVESEDNSSGSDETSEDEQ